MAARIVGRPWTEEEDELLRFAVRDHGEHDNWKIIARSVPGRTNKACRKRWLHSLSPTVKKTAWTADEDTQLLALYDTHGPKWSTIARQIPGRTDDACSKRYREALDPNLKKDEWTPEEDAKLLEVYSRIGGRWGQVGQELQRSGLGCRNRWRLLERKRVSQGGLPRPIPDLQEPLPAQPEPPPLASPSLLPIPEIIHVEPDPPWPPYYPPEAYPSFPSDELYPTTRFREPTPEAIPTVSPHVAPFQFSSSSLSAALSDPPRLPRPLPIVSNATETHTQPQSQINESPAELPVLLDDEDAEMVLQDLFSTENEDTQVILDFLQSNTPSFNDDIQQGSSIGQRRASSTPSFPPSNWDAFSSLTSVSSPYNSPHSSIQFIGENANEYRMQENFSSPASTSFNISSPLSSTPSPGTIPPVELPSSEIPTTGSLLFAGQPTRTVPRRVASKKRANPLVQPRLSSMLPLSADSSVRAYACGRESCWPPEAAESNACFATSKELFDHNKMEHASDPPGDKPFRCTLEGCGKSWKSLNGLQYHLQISTAHFQKALSSSFSAQSLSNGVSESLTISDGPADEADPLDDTQRKYACTWPQCFKAYRQPSGLRYHLKHGHPQAMPAQLEFVPPSLARQIPDKIKKMRQKPAADSDS